MGEIAARGRRAWLLYLLAGGLATAVYFLLPSAAAQDVVVVLVDASVVAAIVVGVLIHRPAHPLPWYLFAVGMGLVFLGDIVWTVYALWAGVPYPRVADGFYFCGLALFVVGLLLVGGGGVGKNGANLIDLLIVATGVAMLCWGLVIQQGLDRGSSLPLEPLLSVGYLVLYAIMIAIVLRPLFLPAKRVPALYLVCAALAVLVLFDTVYGSLLSGSYEAYEAGGFVYAGLLMACVLFGAAALHPSMAPLTESAPSAPAELTWWRLTLLTGALTVAPAVAALQAALGLPVDVLLVAGAEGALFVLVALRMAGMIAERRNAEERLEHQALHDALTDLPNRQLFVDRLRQALRRTRRSEKRSVAVLFMDLDGFKVVNDSLGHEAGDLLLVAVAERLKACLRPADTLARFGGDEFVVLLEDAEGADEPVRVAERITDELRGPFAIEGRELYVRASIGIALGEGRTKGPDDLLRDADTAMYRAKEEGLGHAMFDPAMYERAIDRLKSENDLKRAIEREEFVVHYQPIVDLGTGEVSSIEALVRWEHPEQGLLNPDEFVPIAEESGLVIPMGEQVLREACLMAREWQEENPRTPPLLVSVNLSAGQLSRPGLAETVEAILQEAGLEGSRLTLDVTETVYVKALEVSTTALDRLRKLGVGMSIDDFGIGYSSLSYLKRLPADALKIDKSFVKGLGEDAEDTAIVRMAIELAHTLGMEVVAEGVETGEQAALLADMGCDLGQGFHFSKPLPPADLSKHLARVSSVPLKRSLEHAREGKRTVD